MFTLAAAVVVEASPKLIVVAPPGDCLTRVVGRLTLRSVDINVDIFALLTVSLQRFWPLSDNVLDLY